MPPCWCPAPRAWNTIPRPPEATAGGHVVLIEVADVVPAPAGALVVCRSPLGDALVGWRGDRPPVRGHHHVEWTVDVDLDRGRTAIAAADSAPGIRMDGQVVVL